jgi:aerobic carbon-monoxide dehydrogenase large subunit
MKRKEDPPHLMGRANFVDDLKFRDMVFCALLRSPYPKGKIKDVRRPKDPRLIDFLDGKEVQRLTKPYNKFEMGAKSFERYALATDEIHFVGEPVAAVLATNRYDAEDLLELAQVDYDPSSEPLVFPDVAMKSKSRLVQSWNDNVAYQSATRVGNFEKALSDAAHHFEFETSISRQAAIPIEARGVVALYDPKQGELAIWTPSKAYHATRRMAAASLGINERNVHVMVPDIGGGFGPKGYFYAEELVSCLFSIRNNRPVKWISTRTEDLESTLQARDQIHRTTICFDKELKVTGFKDDYVIDVGTPGFMSYSPTQRLVPLLTGCYKIPNVTINHTAVATNKPEMGPVRGNGRPEAILAIERAVEESAKKLGVDPVEIRRRNFLTPSELPYNNGIGSFYDSGNYPEALDRLCRAVEYSRLRQWQTEERGKGKLIGIGISSYVEDTGLGPSSKIGRPFYETAQIRVESDGHITAFSGSSPHGQGHETVFSEIISKELGVDPRTIVIKFGDTTLIPYGVGSFGSRSAPVAGSAMLLAARSVKEKMMNDASILLGCKAEEVEFDSGKFRGNGKTLSFGEVAESAYVPKKGASGITYGLSAESFFDPVGVTFSNGVALAVVEVDKETGLAKLKSISILDDCGIMIDEDLVEGQVEGGVVHAIGNALFEEIAYTVDGQPLVTNLLDYMIPTATDVPEIKSFHMETPSKMNPLGVKGAGEGGTIGAFAAIVNAISDAVGVVVPHVPARPDELMKLLMKAT